MFRSEKPRAAVISGSDVLIEWHDEGQGVWSHSVPKKWKADQHPGGNPQWVYFNGLPLERASSREGLLPGFFHLNLDARRVFVSPPERLSLEKASVEYAFREGLICPKIGPYPGFNDSPIVLDDIHIIGFTLRHNADWFRGQAALCIVGKRWLVENNLIQRSSYKGMTMGRSFQCVARNNLIEWCGDQGVGGTANVNLLFEGNTVRYNNWRLFDWGNEGGGSKWLKTLDSSVRLNEFAYNHGPGIWFDAMNCGNVYEQNICHDNSARGLFAEISWDEIIQDNVSYNNIDSGIHISHSPDVIARRNVVFNNGAGVYLGGNYTRPNDHDRKIYESELKRVATIPGIDPMRVRRWEANYLKYWVVPKAHTLTDCQVLENIFFDNGVAMIEDRDYRKPSEIDQFVNNFSDHNIFWAPTESDLACVSWQNPYKSLAAWQTASKRDAHSVFADPRAPATKLPKWAADKRPSWDLKLRTLRQVQALAVTNGLVRSPMAMIALGRVYRSPDVEPMTLEDKGIKAFKFDVDGQPVIGLWTTKVKDRRRLRLPLRQRSVTVENGYLQTSERRVTNGVLDLLVTYSPTYVYEGVARR